MTDLFSDERLQFFLRNREDIKAWAAIERDVVVATREVLARSQPMVEERLLGLDPDVIVGRHDSSQWERILARHQHWPAAIGVALEWHRAVDPIGGYPPKLGVFWWADPPSLVEPRTRLIEILDKKVLQELGWKVPLDGVWPVGAYAKSTADWWVDPETWIAGLVERLTPIWPLVAPQIDELLPVDPAVSHG